MNEWVKTCKAHQQKHNCSYKDAMIACSSNKATPKKQSGGFIFTLGALIAGITAAASTTAGTAAIVGASTATGAFLANEALQAIKGSGKKAKLTKGDLKPVMGQIKAVHAKINAQGKVKPADVKNLAKIAGQAVVHKYGQSGSGVLSNFASRFGPILRKFI